MRDLEHDRAIPGSKSPEFLEIEAQFYNIGKANGAQQERDKSAGPGPQPGNQVGTAKATPEVESKPQLKVWVVEWHHPDNSGGLLGVYSSEKAADAAIFEDMGFCYPNWPCAKGAVGSTDNYDDKSPRAMCPTHKRPVLQAYGNWSAWVDYDKTECVVE